MKDLKDMTAKEAIRAAKEESGLTVKEIACGLGVKVSVIKRYLKEDDPYWPSLKTLPLLCAVLGNRLLLDWEAAQLDRGGIERREGMLLSLANAANALEKTGVLIKRTDHLSNREEEGISAGLDMAELECDRIRDLLSHRKGYNDKNEFRCPLWKLWKTYLSTNRRSQG